MGASCLRVICRILSRATRHGEEQSESRAREGTGDLGAQWKPRAGDPGRKQKSQAREVSSREEEEAGRKRSPPTPRGWGPQKGFPSSVTAAPGLAAQPPASALCVSSLEQAPCIVGARPGAGCGQDGAHGLQHVLGRACPGPSAPSAPSLCCGLCWPLTSGRLQCPLRQMSRL